MHEWPQLYVIREGDKIARMQVRIAELIASGIDMDSLFPLVQQVATTTVWSLFDLVAQLRYQHISGSLPDTEAARAWLESQL